MTGFEPCGSCPGHPPFFLSLYAFVFFFTNLLYVFIKIVHFVSCFIYIYNNNKNNHNHNNNNKNNHNNNSFTSFQTFVEHHYRYAIL